jgi:hypothetical protein
LLRHLFVLCTFISLAVCVTVGTLWAIDLDGHTSREITVVVARGRTFSGVYQCDGNIFCGRFEFTPGKPLDRTIEFSTQRGFSMGAFACPGLIDSGVVWPHLGGFGAANYRGGARGLEMLSSAQLVMIPTWLVIAGTAIIPALHFTTIFRRRRHARLGLCPQCGYDLRASPGRCPECGAAAAADGPRAGG